MTILRNPEEIKAYLDKSRKEWQDRGGYEVDQTVLCRFEYCPHPSGQCPNPE